MKKTIESNELQNNTCRNHLRQLFYLRWIAIAGQVVTIALINYHLAIPLPIISMFSIVGALALFNCFAWYRLNKGVTFSEQEIFFQLIVDIIAFTGQLYFSGGASNPFVSLFLLQVIIAATILSPAYTWLTVSFTACCYLLVSFFYVEIPHFLHYHLGQFFNLHTHGMFISFAMSAILIAYFIVKLASHVKERDTLLSKIRDQSLAEEHIIKLGMMAAGAAHELGTPLSTIAVVARELQRDGKQYPELAPSLAVLESQVGRCKQALNHILGSVQQPRAEEAHILPLDLYITSIIKRWKQGVTVPYITYTVDTLPPVQVVTEKVLEQAIVNILDNAAEAAKDHISITALEEGGNLTVTIEDNGKGIPHNHSIAPHHTSKRSGNGLGLFLSQTVIQRLGGSLKISALPDTGTRAIISIPMEALYVSG